MADKKISELTNIIGADLSDDDEFVVVDTSAAETKAITYAELKKINGDLTVSGTVDGRDLSVDGAKLDGIESGATGDQAASEVPYTNTTSGLTATNVQAAVDEVEGRVDTLESVSHTHANKAVLDATTASFTTADETKLDGIETNADVTDTANVTAAGALMDSELTNINAVKALDQGVATTDSPSFVGVTATTADIDGGTIDGTTIGGTTPAAVTTSSLVATTADINGGTIDGVTIGGSSAGAITGTTITGSSFVTTGDMTFGDNDKAIFGAGSDLQIYSDGSTGIIQQVGPGVLVIKGQDFYLQNDAGENFIRANTDASVLLFHDNAAKLSTTSTGVDVTGSITVSGTVDGRDIAADGSKLDGIEAGADVTDTANVTSAGALMDSELTDIAAVKALDQGVATTDDPTFTGVDLAAIAASKAVTAVDVFVYDTSKDSDGGAWRKRTQHTSWYNETLNTATRGSRREFPAVAVIVAEATKVTIYDGDDPALPMWMVFNQSSGGFVYSSTVAAVVSFNGQVEVGMSGAGGGRSTINFVADFGYYQTNNGTEYNRKSVSAPNYGTVTVTGTVPPIVNREVNDVAMTVLPDAPIDPATGLPVPTIAVATDGGVSVITDAGTVYDITYTAYGVASRVAFTGDNKLTFGVWNDPTQPRSFKVYAVPTADIAEPTPGYLLGTYSLEDYNLYAGGTYDLRAFQTNSDGKGLTEANGVLRIASTQGLVSVLRDATSPGSGSVNLLTSTYNTGWMNGDIKGAFLSDTDDTDLVGTTVVSEDFASGLGGFTAFNEYAVVSNVSGRLRVASNDASEYGRAVRSFTTVVGMTYVVEMETFVGSGAGVVFYVGSSAGGSQYGIYSGAGVKRVTFKAATTTSYITCYNDGVRSTNYAEYDNLTVKLADADRSVNNNGLIVNGTVTRSAVATGAELVAYSGFSVSNYLEQPYNSALDFGTGDFCVMGWSKTNSAGLEGFFERRNGSSGSSITVHNAYGAVRGTIKGVIDVSAASGSANTGNWTHIAFLRKSSVLYLYVNGVLAGSAANTTNLTIASATVALGAYVDATQPATAASLALWRISATAPTAEQIKKIYEDEKVLFQENAACTLYGASDAVTALAHDSDTGLLHVGTSAGRSVFQGLRRVSNTTTAVGTAISASNSLVVEE